MNPKLRGIAEAMAKLNHNLDDRADKLMQRIEGAEARSATAFAGAHKQLDDAEKAVGDVEQFIAGLAGSNGAPTSGGSSVSPAQPPSQVAPEPVQAVPAEPGASWSGKP